MTDLMLRSIETLRGPSATDLVFRELYRRIVELELPPGMKLSEQEVARQMGISRQPVRDAFYRLSQLGLILIQPQRATTVSLISEEAVLQARFVRTALEMETARIVARRLTKADVDAFERLIAQQEVAMTAGDRVGFHALDDEFHQAISQASGNGFAWALVRENKAHMDRVRYLSLGFNAASALADHRVILAALTARDPERAAEAMRVHLSRILGLISQIRAESPAMFTDPAEAGEAMPV